MTVTTEARQSADDTQTTEGSDIVTNLLEGYLSDEEAAQQLGISTRTLARMRMRGEVAWCYVGKFPYIDVEATREILRSRLVKPVTTSKDPRTTRGRK
jgi:hypothetical protein